MTSKEKTRKLVVAGMFSAISIVLGLTPLGIIPLPIANATTMHIPVILAAVLEGPWAGMAVGLIFGATSMIKSIVAPTSLLSPFLMNPLVSVLPRVLIGLLSYLVYTGLLRLLSKNAGGKKNAYWPEMVSTGAAAAVGTLVNTVGVLGMVWLLYGAQYAAAMEIAPAAIGGVLGGIVVSNGIPEICVAVLLCVPIERALRHFYTKKKKKLYASGDAKSKDDAPNGDKA